MLHKTLSSLAINALRIGNFKVFSNTQYIPIRPLTLIYGVNNSGKSSILHSLLFANHAIENARNLTREFDDYVRGYYSSKPIEWAVEIDPKRLDREILYQVQQLAVGVTLGMERKEIEVLSFFIEADGKRIVDMSIRSDGLLGCDRLELQHPAFKVIIDEIMEAVSDSREDVETFINEQLVPKMVAKATRLFPKEIKIVEENPKSSFDSTIILSGLNEIIGSVVRAIENDLERLRYFGPSRNYIYRSSNSLSIKLEINIEFKMIIPHISIKRSRESLNRLYKYDLKPFKDKEVMNYLKQNSAESISDVFSIDKITKTDVSDPNVGMGVNQLIPILFDCHKLSNGLVAIEQPEIYLHPKPQAELGDLFIKSALGKQKNTFIIETHSENLLLRIMRRMRETFYEQLPEGVPPVKPEDVSLLFVNPDEDGSIVMEMPLNKKGELKKSWPGGFFEEGLEEVFG